MKNKMPRKIVRYPTYDNARDLPLVDLCTRVCIGQASIKADHMSYERPETGDKEGRKGRNRQKQNGRGEF